MLATYNPGASETKVYTPFPDYEVTDPPTGANVTRTTYRLGGQIAALRVNDGATNKLYYPLTDHLGNVMALSDVDGNFVSGSDARYDPFGAFTTTPTTNPSISNLGFTGHRHNNTGANNLGLIYMNARYYLPEVGRFISADTIVPEPGNPQSYNRYTYTLNNPVNFTDPTGHLTEEEILEFFGFANPAEAESAGWQQELIELIWYKDFTWGMVFRFYRVSDNYTAYAMLVLFEAGDPSATTLEGGFYGITGAVAGQKVEGEDIKDPYAQAPLADKLQARYRDNWDKMPVSYNSDYTGIPVFLPSIYTQTITENSIDAGVTLIGGTATLVGCAITPCAPLLPLIGLGSSTYGVVAVTRDILSPDVSLFARYPLIQKPRGSIIPSPTQYFDFRPRGGPR